MNVPFEIMKQFMMIFQGGDYITSQLSPDEIQQRMQKWFAWVEDLKQKELYVSGEPLTADAKKVSGVNQVVTDGPFVDAKELVGGFFVVKANDWDHAVSLTNGFPDYDLGGAVEVREVMIYGQE